MVRLERDANLFRMATVKDPATGEVLALGSRFPLMLEAVGTKEWVLCLSDGVRTTESRVALK